MQGVHQVKPAEWLRDVQRDPRTVGAFRRRIETLLNDGTVARRIAQRLQARSETGRASAPEPLEAPADRVAAVLPARLNGPASAVVARTGKARSIFGVCPCNGCCCLMVPDLRTANASVAPASRATGSVVDLRH